MRGVLISLLCMMQMVSGLVLQPAGPVALQCQISPVSSVSMGCRNNLKKEKRLRNRMNAFRFKKNTGFQRFNNFADRGAESKKEAEDAEYMSLIFTYSAAAAQAEAAAAEEGAPAAPATQ